LTIKKSFKLEKFNILLVQKQVTDTFY